MGKCAKSNARHQSRVRLGISKHSSNRKEKVLAQAFSQFHPTLGRALPYIICPMPTSRCPGEICYICSTSNLGWVSSKNLFNLGFCYLINQLKQTTNIPNARQSLMIPMLELQDILAAATAKARVSQNFHSYWKKNEQLKWRRKGHISSPSMHYYKAKKASCNTKLARTELYFGFQTAKRTCKFLKCR